MFTSSLGTRAELNALLALCDGGTGAASATLIFYDGTPPADVDTALSGNNVLAQLAMSNPAFGAATDLNPGAQGAAATISDDTDADASGTCTFARVVNRAGTPILQFTVSTVAAGTGEIQYASTAFSQHATIKAPTSLVVKRTADS